MSFEEKLKAKIQQAEETEFLPLDTLPTTITAKVVGEPQFKNDGRGNEGLYMILVQKDETKIIQKYTKTTYQELESTIEECGGLAKLQKEFHIWTQKKVGRAFNDRYYPLPKQTPKT